MIRPARTGAIGRRILWFHPRPLLPARSGGELRVTGLIDAAVRAGHSVLVVEPGALGEPQPADFRVLEVPRRGGLGLALAKIFATSPLRSARITRLGRRRARDQIATFRPDVVVVSDLFSWPLAGALMPPVPWIFDDHNVETNLYREFAQHATTLLDRVTFEIDRRRVARLESRLVSEATAVVAVSEEDARALVRLGAPGRKPVVVPSSVPTPPELGPLTAKPVLLFVGSLTHPPNVEAVRELVEVILPKVRESVPPARLIVAGRNPTAELRTLLEMAENVEFREGLPDLHPVYREARCTVMPIRSGSGSRLKVYEALAYGLPAVGTAQAFAGVDLSDCALTAETPEDLVAAAVRLIREDDLAASLRARSRTHFVEHLSWQHAATPLLDLIDDVT